MKRVCEIFMAEEQRIDPRVSSVLGLWRLN